MGYQAGASGQGNAAVAIGFQAGYTGQGNEAVAIGSNAGYTGQGIYAVAIGSFAGASGQGSGSVAIGYNAGQTNQANNSICISALGTTVNNTITGTTVIRPLRVESVDTNSLMIYNTTTGELTYSSATTIAAKTFVIDHPLDDSKYLVHACLEGPEVGVYYRGEGIIPDDENNIEISLPEYTKDFVDFTVNITPKFNGKLRLLNVGDVENGVFKVYGDSGPFSWVVFGKRHNIDVEPKKNSVVVKGDGPYTYLA